MKEIITTLLQLQDLDTEIFRLKTLKKELPEELEKARVVCEDFEGRLAESKEQLKRLQLEQKEKEIELQDKEGQIAKLQLQLNQVKKNEEYTALQNEIKSTRADNSIIEEEILGIMDKVDKGKEDIEEKKKELEEQKQEVEKKKREVETELKRIEAELSQLAEKKNQVASNIDKNTLHVYENIMANKQAALAVVPIKDTACQGCFMNVRPQLINEARLNEKLVICENCSRIMYIDEATAKSDAS